MAIDGSNIGREGWVISEEEAAFSVAWVEDLLAHNRDINSVDQQLGVRFNSHWRNRMAGICTIRNLPDLALSEVKDRLVVTDQIVGDYLKVNDAPGSSIWAERSFPREVAFPTEGTLFIESSLNCYYSGHESKMDSDLRKLLKMRSDTTYSGITARHLPIADLIAFGLDYELATEKPFILNLEIRSSTVLGQSGMVATLQRTNDGRFKIGKAYKETGSSTLAAILVIQPDMGAGQG